MITYGAEAEMFTKKVVMKIAVLTGEAGEVRREAACVPWPMTRDQAHNLAVELENAVRDLDEAAERPS